MTESTELISALFLGVILCTFVALIVGWQLNNVYRAVLTLGRAATLWLEARPTEGEP